MRKNNKRNNKKLDITVEVKYLPFPSEEARQEAYYTHASLWFKAKGRMLKKMSKSKPLTCISQKSRKALPSF